MMDAITRIQQLGMPRRNNELWSFFPVAKIPTQEYANVVAKIPANTNLDFQNLIDNENDFAALLPIAKGAKPMVHQIASNANEMAMLKCNNDFGHTILNIDKGANVSLEILDNKVEHEIAAERFDICVAENANVEIFFANPSCHLPLRFRHFRITQAANSMVHFSNVIKDVGIGRISIDVQLNGENANFEYRSLSNISENASMHTHLNIYHNAPHTTSTQLARNLLADNAFASYDGCVIVRENCTGVNSSQLVNTILLSKNACISVKPVLKIYHDDVECTHGNTVGELDIEQMFYLISRGIPQKMAEQLLIHSFAQETFLALPETPAKKRIMQSLKQR